MYKRQLTDIKKDLKNRLSERRYVHSAGVAASAYILAEKYGYNPKKAELAGWLHDCAKEMKLEEMQDIIDEQNLQVDEYMRSSRALLHGPAGSIMAKTIYGIKDRDIQNSIFFHTTGRPQMELLDKIIFLADYIEPSRDFPGINIIRRNAQKNLDTAVLSAYDATIRHLLDQKEYIYELTFLGRNDLIKHMGNK